MGPQLWLSPDSINVKQDGSAPDLETNSPSSLFILTPMPPASMTLHKWPHISEAQFPLPMYLEN